MNRIPFELPGNETAGPNSGAVTAEPPLVLADEPSGNLDGRTAGELHELLAFLARERHQTFVLVTHNDRLAGMADRVMRLEAGRLIEA